MARPRRIQTPNLVRHVMSRGNGRMRIFFDDHDYCRLLVILDEVTTRFDVECWQYCVMPNHYHLVLRPRLENFSEAVQHLNSQYGEWWNWRHRHVGHVFQGRFKDQIVDTHQYLRVLCRYIAMNPVRALLTNHPARWRWSSYAATIGNEPRPRFLTVDNVLNQFGNGDDHDARSRYAQFVLSRADPHEDDRIRSKARILGDAAFRQTLAAIVGPDYGLTPSRGTRRGD